MRELDVLVALTGSLRRDHGIAVEMLDMGGGFAITYTDERTPSIADIAAAAELRLRVGCGELGLPVPTLAAEPGRSIVGNPAVTLYRVGDRRTLGDGRTVIAVDGGMSDNIRPMLYDARYTVAPASRAAWPGRRDRDHRRTPLRVRRRARRRVALPSDVERGDLLAFAATGAYTYPLASTYNRVGRPAVVAVEDGRATVWVRREESGDLDRLEAPRPADGARRGRLRPASRSARPRPRTPGRSWRSGRRSSARAGTSAAKRSTPRRASIARGSDVRGPTARRRWWRSTPAASWDTSTSSAKRHPVTRHVATLGIAVSADRRGQGIGRALMAEAFRWAVEQSAWRRSCCRSTRTTTPRSALYRRFGFVEEGRLVGHSRKSSGYEDEILMSAWITEGPSPW